MSPIVRTTPEADVQIREVDDWWRNNRTAARDLFLDELTAAFDIISHAPEIGRPYRRSHVPGTRRLLLAKCRYHVYYVREAVVVKVLAAAAMRSRLRLRALAGFGWDSGDR